jgi:hypothetical protein
MVPLRDPSRTQCRVERESDMIDLFFVVHIKRGRECILILLDLKRIKNDKFKQKDIGIKLGTLRLLTFG